MRLFSRGLVAALLVAGCSLGTSLPAGAQDKKDDAEDISVVTVDGLRLVGTWYGGKRGRNSDTVIMLHGWGQNSSKGDWQTLAKTLNDNDFAVLTFDFRGHGKSTTAKAIGDEKEFCDVTKYPFNKLARVPLVPSKLKSLNYKSFDGGYIPYMVNDIAAARRFIDQRNDNGECNSGRIFLVAEREMCALGMLWIGTEFFRQAINPAQGGVAAPAEYKGGRDIMGAVWLSYRTPSVLGNAVNRLMVDPKIAPHVEATLREKIGMAFVQGEDDQSSHQAARYWFSQFRIRPGQKEDKELGKYLIDVKGAKSLAGGSLLDPKLGVDQQILSFLKATKKKNMTGSDNQPRNPNALPAAVVPLDQFGFVVR